MTTPHPCLPCPWLQTNHGKPHPDGWYTKANLRRLWAGLRNGDSMSCHLTDPENPVSDRAAAAGYHPAPDHAATRECVGALILQQRELQLVHDAPDLAAYLRTRRAGLTRRGVAQLVNRLMFGGSILAREIPLPDLNTPVAHDPLSWTPRTDGADDAR